MNKLSGKGYYIWRVNECFGGDIGRIAIAAQDSGLGHVLIKIADGPTGYNGDVRPLVETLQRKGIEVWGWQYIYGYPAPEARMVVRRIRESGVTGLVANAEVEFKRMPNPAPIARSYMQSVRAEVGTDFPIALSTYRYPKYHPQFPYTAFLEYCDFNMPQVYWLLQHNPVWQLEESMRQYRALIIQRPTIPTGCAWQSGSWAPTSKDLVDFMDAARRLGCEAANYWAFDHTHKLPGLWQTIAEYDWPVVHPTPPEPEPDPIEIPEDDVDYKKLDEILAKYPNAQLNINVSMSVDSDQLADPGDPGVPAPVGKDYRVVIPADKPSGRAKVRPVANAGSAEIDYVKNGEVVSGPGRTVNEFTYITARVGGVPLIGPGFVETEYLVPLS